MITFPFGDEWEQGQPEKEMKAGPEDFAVHVPACVEHVMMVVPIDSQVDKAENVRREYRKQWL
jgi:hypothetical protein